MKIHDLLQQLNTPRPTGGRKATATDFDQLLQARLRQAGPASGSREGRATGEADKGAAALRLQGLAVTESTLATLDAFGAALADLSLSSDALAPYASALEEETAALVATRNALPADDPLAALLDRVATVSYLEATKLRRGDYR